MSTLTATSSDHVRRSPTTTHSFLACCALLGTFVIESHCGANRVDHADQAIRYLEQKLYTRALREARRAARQNGDESRPHLIAVLAVSDYWRGRRVTRWQPTSCVPSKR